VNNTPPGCGDKSLHNTVINTSDREYLFILQLSIHSISNSSLASYLKANKMATAQPNINGKEDLRDHTPSQRLSSLSLSSQTIHADDFLNKGQDVAPPLHVSTTFRYSNNPDALVPADELDVSPILDKSTPPSESRKTFPSIT
jgi:hypothetical protein